MLNGVKHLLYGKQSLRIDSSFLRMTGLDTPRYRKALPCGQ
jgi:hypothetical protein